MGVRDGDPINIFGNILIIKGKQRLATTQYLSIIINLKCKFT